MYHYVRDLINSDYPKIKGLDVSLFKEHVSYIKREFVPVTVEEIVKAANNRSKLPDNAVLLTFDDGYVDHYEYVFPILKENDIQGAFYAPVQAITEHKVLDVNKIHFILAACEDKGAIIDDIRSLVNESRAEFNLDSFETYYEKLAHPNRFDTAEVIFIKRLLQVELPTKVRQMMTDTIFLRYVGVSEKQFSKELYMNTDHMRTMLAAGMHIGAHGFRHEWLAYMSPEEQSDEVKRSVAFLDKLGTDEGTRTVCYPYGSYNDSLLSILKSNNFQLGMTTKAAIADLGHDANLTLPRIDANDLTAQIQTMTPRIP